MTCSAIRRSDVATRNEDLPGSCEVKQNKGTKAIIMLKEYKVKTNLFILFGITVQFGGAILASAMEVDGLSILFRIVGAILLITGCCYYAKGKGYHVAWGLLGVFSLIGLIVLVCMRDKRKTA